MQPKAASLVIVLALALVGIWADFIPTSGWSLFSKAFTFLASIPVVWFFWRQIYRAPNKSFIKKLAHWLVAPFISYIFIMPATVSGLPYIATFIIGTDRTRVETLEKLPPKRKGCKQRMGGPLLKPAFSNHICVTPEEFSKFPSRGSYILYVREWHFGYIVQHIQYRSSFTGTDKEHRPLENPNRIFK
ncbi:hypothetical protein IB232_00070 [Pseudomonas sp. PDM15]|uniref:hypothetical protein n=1 Tax=Pseudomonas sp. PDM15 TaxID=2769303 RepID=UPI00177F0255|nr:hypothetical protein [Pseudomonas sp. PDM15]MBD9423704.1 hypothetical protein [Pseudomonas sp. PDM15]